MDEASRLDEAIETGKQEGITIGEKKGKWKLPSI